MTLMNRTNNHGSRRNIYSNSGRTDAYKAPINAPINAYKAPINSYKAPTNSYKAPDTQNSHPPPPVYSSGGMGVDIPQAFVDDETGLNAGMRRNALASRTKRSAGTGRSWMVTFGILVIFVLVSGYSLVSYHERKMMKTQLTEQDNTMRALEIDLSMQFDSKIQKLKEENAKLQAELSDEKTLKVLNQNLKDQKKQLDKTLKNAKQDIKLWKNKSETVSKSRTTLRANIQRMSREAVLAKFGPGPHRLEMYVRYDSHLGRTDGGFITIEMAPLDQVPHAVHLFLEQVSLKLYDGYSFHRNAGHVIQGGPHPNFLSDPKRPPSEQPFKDAGLHSMLFQEYSDKFPHQKHTLGFAGRPGGPEFYINTKDNSKIHGPWGQQNYDDPSEADTCFAKVVDGFDQVDRISGLPVKEGSHKALVDNVVIETIRLMGKNK